MTEDPLERLITLAGPALSDSTPRLTDAAAAVAGPLSGELLKLYWRRNGFFAFESALHVFPVTTEVEAIDLTKWNSASLWRSEFGSLTDDLLFFAEDVFGDQFCVQGGAVYRFHVETGDRELIADSIARWADLVVKDYQLQTGWPLAHQWQAAYGPLPQNKRLVPKTPFALGGEFSLANLRALDRVTAMRFYGSVAIQIHDLADGREVRMRVVD